jgi:uncharacterized protein YtpQ (UPF0354 family)
MLKELILSNNDKSFQSDELKELEKLLASEKQRTRKFSRENEELAVQRKQTLKKITENMHKRDLVAKMILKRRQLQHQKRRNMYKSKLGLVRSSKTVVDQMLLKYV